MLTSNALLHLQGLWTALLNWVSHYDWGSEFTSTILQTLLVAPLVSVVVTAWQRASERKQRVRMIPELVWSTFPIRRIMDTIVEGPDGDFVSGGLEIFARQFESQTESMYEPDQLAFYLGQPQFLSGVLKERVTQQCNYVDGLLDLFAPHFRTKDAISAQRMRSALREVGKAVGKVEEGVSVLCANIGGTSKFLAHLREVDSRSEALEGDDGRAVRDSIRKQATEKMTSKSRGLAQEFQALPQTLEEVAVAAMALIEGFYDDRVSYTKIIAKLEKQEWFRDEQVRLASRARGSSDSSAEVALPGSSNDPPDVAKDTAEQARN